MSEPAAQPYSCWQRMLEYLAIGVFAVLSLWAFVRLSQAAGYYFLLIAVPAAILAWLLVDLMSGFMHFALDSWGSVQTPIVGKAFIRPFREHHVRPQEMTQHDFVELNGASSLVCLPILAGVITMPHTSVTWMALQAVLLFMALGGIVTNNCHKWAHTELADIPVVVRWAQMRRLILCPEHHKRHHTPPFNSHFCMASGWLNGFLNAFLRTLR